MGVVDRPMALYLGTPIENSSFSGSAVVPHSLQLFE